jgi:hypothetical protein
MVYNYFSSMFPKQFRSTYKELISFALEVEIFQRCPKIFKKVPFTGAVEMLGASVLIEPA